MVKREKNTWVQRTRGEVRRTVLPQVHAGTGSGPRRLTTDPVHHGGSFALIPRGYVRGGGKQTEGPGREEAKEEAKARGVRVAVASRGGGG